MMDSHFSEVPPSVGIKARLDRSLRVADALSGSEKELLSAAADLVVWGEFTSAERLIEHIESIGTKNDEIIKLKNSMDRLKNAGPEYSQTLLSNAINAANNSSSSADQLLRALEFLVVWGALDEADRVIERLEGVREVGGRLAILKATSRQLRRSGILDCLSAADDSENAGLNRPHEALVARHDGQSDRGVIVFTGAARRFWLSLHVLHQFLRKYRVHVIFMSDHAGAMFLNGLESVAPSYSDMVGMLKSTLSDLGVRKTYVMGMSAGGFVGLRVAADLESDGFLGLSVRTDLSGRVIKYTTYDENAVGRCTDKDMLINIRNYIDNSAYPSHIYLYSGDGNPVDVAHAENMRGMDRTSVRYLKSFSGHNIVPGLLAAGVFEAVLSELFESGGD